MQETDEIRTGEELSAAPEEEQMDTVVTEKYDANQIQVLEGLEAVRKRPGMYIGSTGPRGLHHLVYEILDNSIDEALAGYCTHIEVDILPGDIISVRDNGRGIPVDINEKQGIPAVTVVLTVLHAGGKFGGSGYKVSGGLHGVGSSVVNALSEWLEVQVSQNGHIYRQRFERGNIASELEIIGDTEAHRFPRSRKSRGRDLLLRGRHQELFALFDREQGPHRDPRGAHPLLHPAGGQERRDQHHVQRRL